MYLSATVGLGKSRFTSGQENVIHVTSENTDDYKIVQISIILVSSVETTTKVETSQWKRKLWHILGPVYGYWATYELPKI